MRTPRCSSWRHCSPTSRTASRCRPSRVVACRARSARCGWAARGRRGWRSSRAPSSAHGCSSGRGAARLYIADALDVRHRLPLIWAKVVAREARIPWVRLVASKTRHLSVEAAAHVDAAMAEFVDGCLSWGRFESRLDGKIVKADPETAAAREAARMAEQVAKRTRSSERGTAGFFIRSSIGVIARIDATVAFVAEALQAFGDTDPLDERRVKAVLVLCNPAKAVELLAAYAALRSPTHRRGAAAGRDRRRARCPARSPAGSPTGTLRPDALARMDAFARRVGIRADPATGVVDRRGPTSRDPPDPPDPPELRVQLVPAPATTDPQPAPLCGVTRARRRRRGPLGGGVRRDRAVRPRLPASAARLPDPAGHRPGRHGAGRRLRDPRPAPHRGAPAVTGGRVPVRSQPPEQGRRRPHVGVPPRPRSGSDAAGQPGSARSLRAPGQDVRALDAASAVLRDHAVARPTRPDLPGRPHRHPQGHRGRQPRRGRRRTTTPRSTSPPVVR